MRQLLNDVRSLVRVQQINVDFDINYTKVDGKLKVQLFGRTEITIGEKTYSTPSEMLVDPKTFWDCVARFVEEHQSIQAGESIDGKRQAHPIVDGATVG